MAEIIQPQNELHLVICDKMDFEDTMVSEVMNQLKENYTYNSTMEVSQELNKKHSNGQIWND